jgi:hypothetical protein
MRATGGGEGRRARVRNLGPVGCVSPAELRHRSRVLLARANQVRPDTQEARLRAAKMRSMADAVRAFGEAHRVAFRAAAAQRNADRRSKTITFHATPP